MYKISYTDPAGIFRVVEPGTYVSEDEAINAVPRWACNYCIWKVL